jgi:hypothetical protein
MIRMWPESSRRLAVRSRKSEVGSRASEINDPTSDFRLLTPGKFKADDRFDE